MMMDDAMEEEAKKCPWMLLPETGTTDDEAIALWDRFVISNFAFHTCCTVLLGERGSCKWRDYLLWITRSGRGDR